MSFHKKFDIKLFSTMSLLFDFKDKMIDGLYLFNKILEKI